MKNLPLAIAIASSDDMGGRDCSAIYSLNNLLGRHIHGIVWMRVPTAEERNIARNRMRVNVAGEREWWATPSSNADVIDWVKVCLPYLAPEDLRTFITEATALILNP